MEARLHNDPITANAPTSHREPTLKDVINYIPNSLRPEKPSITKGLLYVAFDFVVYIASLIGLVYANAWLYLPLLVVNVLSIGGLFILAHDACHGSLFGRIGYRRLLAYLVGQAAMLPGGHMFDVWGYGHNRVHHGHTVRQGFDFVWHPVSPEQYEKFGIIGRVWHRVCWSPIGHGLYYFWHIWGGKMWLFWRKKETGLNIRCSRDKAIVALYLVVMAAWMIYTYGVGAWIKAIVIPFFLWNYYIGFVVYVQHIHEQVVWRIKGAWTPFRGQIEGTVTFVTYPFINWVSHNILVHTPHHADMRIPFYNLPRAMKVIRERFGDYVVEHPLNLREYLKTTFVCQLFDFQRQEWYPSLAVAQKGWGQSRGANLGA